MSRRDRIAALAGAALFAAGVSEARRLALGTEAEMRRSAVRIGLTRALAGTALLTRPTRLAAVIGGDSSGAARVPWLARMVGVREIVLGLRTVVAGGTGTEPRRWLLATSLIDAGEALVVVDAVRGRTVAHSAGLAFAAADAGSAIAGAGLVGKVLKSGAARWP